MKPDNDQAIQGSMNAEDFDRLTNGGLASAFKKRTSFSRRLSLIDRIHRNLSLNGSKQDRLSQDSQDAMPSEKCEEKAATRRAWFYPDMPWGVVEDKIDPAKRRGRVFLQFWDLCSFFGVLYIAFSVPYSSAFLEVEGHSCTLESENTVKVAVDVLVDAFFFLDIALQFFAARWNLVFDGSPHWELIDDLPTIQHNYIWGDLYLDILGQIPWQYLDCLVSQTTSMLGLLRLFRLLKLFRLSRIRRVIDSVKRQFPFSTVVLTLLKLLLTTILIAHWMCCIWFYIGVPNGWVREESMINVDGTLKENQGYYNWISSFYWAVTTMTTIGYGDIVASTTEERTLAVVVMIMGVASFAWVTGRITQMLTTKAMCITRFDERMEEIREYVKFRNLPHELHSKATNYYMMRFPTQRIFDECAILEDLPVDLRRDVCLELYRDVVSKAPLFFVAETEIKREICFNLIPNYKTAGMKICNEGEIPDFVYILRYGEVLLVRENETLKVIQEGHIFGENAILGFSHDGHRTRTAVAKTCCELCMLPKSVMLSLINSKVQFRHQCQHVIGQHLAMLSIKTALNLKLKTADVFCIRWEDALRKKMRHSAAMSLSRQADTSVSTSCYHNLITLNFLYFASTVKSEANEIRFRILYDAPGTPSVDVLSSIFQVKDRDFLIPIEGYVEFDLYSLRGKTWEEAGDLVIHVLGAGGKEEEEPLYVSRIALREVVRMRSHYRSDVPDRPIIVWFDGVKEGRAALGISSLAVRLPWPSSRWFTALRKLKISISSNYQTIKLRRTVTLLDEAIKSNMEEFDKHVSDGGDEEAYESRQTLMMTRLEELCAKVKSAGTPRAEGLSWVSKQLESLEEKVEEVLQQQKLSHLELQQLSSRMASIEKQLFEGGGVLRSLSSPSMPAILNPPPWAEWKQSLSAMLPSLTEPPSQTTAGLDSLPSISARDLPRAAASVRLDS